MNSSIQRYIKTKFLHFISLKMLYYRRYCQCFSESTAFSCYLLYHIEFEIRLRVSVRSVKSHYFSFPINKSTTFFSTGPIFFKYLFKIFQIFFKEGLFFSSGPHFLTLPSTSISFGNPFLTVGAWHIWEPLLTVGAWHIYILLISRPLSYHIF